MRRLFILGALAALLVAPSASAATATVRIVRSGFSPATATIRAGDTVRWVNADTVNHQVVSDTGAFASPVLAPGRAFSFTFGAAGRYRYRDALEPVERATVMVRGVAPAVSMAASAPIVVYGGEVKLTGAVSSQ